MKHLAVAVLLVLAGLAVLCTVGILAMAAVVTVIDRARAHRSRCCACGTWPLPAPESWTWAAGVLHERHRCQPDREAV